MIQVHQVDACIIDCETMSGCVGQWVSKLIMKGGKRHIQKSVKSSMLDKTMKELS